ncbi:hypothetical protein BDQ17DRAFT_1253463, partial [Cyathus striatus]
TTYEVEAVGVIMGAWLLKHYLPAPPDPSSILTDGKSVLQALDKKKLASVQYLQKAIVDGLAQARAVDTQCHGEPTNHDITLRWISGHSNVTGNEVADMEAKKAAAGSSSPLLSLPPILHQQRGLPVSLAAI